MENSCKKNQVTTIHFIKNVKQIYLSLLGTLLEKISDVLATIRPLVCLKKIGTPHGFKTKMKISYYMRCCNARRCLSPDWCDRQQRNRYVGKLQKHQLSKQICIDFTI